MSRIVPPVRAAEGRELSRLDFTLEASGISRTNLALSANEDEWELLDDPDS
jgi:hypothetical protein